MSPEEYSKELLAQGATVYKRDSVHVTSGASMHDFYPLSVVHKAVANLALKESLGAMQAEDVILKDILTDANIIQKE